MRSIALDVHRDYCEVAIKDGGEVRSAGRLKTSRKELSCSPKAWRPQTRWRSRRPGRRSRSSA